jgi:molecular chaperone GrpE
MKESENLDTDAIPGDSDPMDYAGQDGVNGAAAKPVEAGADYDAGAEQEIASLAAEVAKQKDKYLRLYADYENLRKRAVRERQEAESKGMGYLIKGILDTLDDLGRFAHLDPAATDTKTVIDGVELVERKIMKSLAGHGLELVNPVDAPFDPTFHEAITTVPAASKQEDHFVAQVYQVGYLFNGQLLRPARVVVKQWNGADSAAE